MSQLHWVCPRSACVLSRSTLLRLQVALQGNCLERALGCVQFPGLSRLGSGSRVLHKGTDSVGHVFCALPRLEQLRRPDAWQAHCPRWAVFCSPPWSQTLSFLGVLQEHRLRCAVCLLWGADLWLWPSWWMSTVQDPRKTWLATGGLLSLVEDAEIAPLPLALAVACLPLCLQWGWAGLQPGSSPLIFAQSFVL